MADNPKRERNMKLPVVESGGRFYTKYNPQMALDIVERIADGELLMKITAKDATPLTVTKQTFLKWVATVPDLAKAYAAALQLSAQSFEEFAIDKAVRTAEQPGSPQNVSAASLLVSQYRWSAARRNPTRYSDKGNTQIVVPVTINTTLGMGSSTGADAVEVPDIYTIKLNAEDAEFTEVSTPEAEVLPVTSRERASEQFRSLIRPEVPVVGTQSQPLLARTGKAGGVRGPRKRVLTPRIPKK